jgi:hypothetical protein
MRGNYPDRNVGLIFNGDVRFTISGRDNPTDTWTLLQCIDAWEGHLKASVKTTVAAGWKYDQLFSLGMESYKPTVLRLALSLNFLQQSFRAGVCFIRTHRN